MDKTPNKYWAVLICLALALSTLAVYWQVRHNDFVDFDDNWYIYDESHIWPGLTWDGFLWALTADVVYNWHPLTLLSHMLDCQLYDLDPGAHHLMNVLFHIANALLLFLVLNSMTKCLWPSAFVAAAFALHPLHVESVAWASERKDVLSTFFWMLSMAAYIHYVRRPAISRYLLMLSAFVLGLMAKPAVVTLPFVLLLLDYWPLGRLRLGQVIQDPVQQNKKPVSIGPGWQIVYRLVWEKVPLFIFSAIISVVTFLIQRKYGIAKSIVEFPVLYRIENALVSYVAYIEKMLWPNRLAIFYPHPPGGLPIWKVAGSLLLLVSITAAVVWERKRRPYLIVGWLWYLGTLVPMIGLVQVAQQAMADRYTYIPLTGLFIIIAWSIPDLIALLHHRKVILSLSAAVLLPALAVTSWFQVKHWQNSVTLYRHATLVVKDNWWAHIGLANALSREGRTDEARKEWENVAQIGFSRWTKQLQLKPDDPDSHFNLGFVLLRQEKYDDAVGHFSKALQVKPDWPEAYYCLGMAYHLQGNYEQAIRNYHEAIRLRPHYADAIKNLEMALKRQGNINQDIKK